MNNMNYDIPKKKQKLEDEHDDGLWDSDDEELAVQADILETQALSQRPSAVIGGSRVVFGEPNTFCNGNIKYPTTTPYARNPPALLPVAVSNRSNSTEGMVQPVKRPFWRSSTEPDKRLCPQSTVYASQIKSTNDSNLNLECQKLKEKLKELEDARAAAEARLLEVQAQNSLLKEQQSADEQRVQNNLKTIQNLESQLAFKMQEVTSIHFNQSQQTSLSKIPPHFQFPAAVAQPKTNHVTNGLTKHNDSSKQLSNFPTPSSFSKCLSIPAVPISASTSSHNSNIDASKSTIDMKTTNKAKSGDDHVVLKVNNERVEAQLMKSLIQSSKSLSIGSEPASLITLLCNPNRSPNSSSSEVNVKHDYDAAVVELALTKCLSQNEFFPPGNTKLSDEIFVWSQSCLQNDCGEVFLRFIEDRLLLPSKQKLQSQVVSNTGDNLFSISNWYQSLHLMERLIDCSPRLRNCILQETYVDATSRWGTIQQFTSVSSESEVSRVNKPCCVLKTLFNFFTPAFQSLIDDSNYTKMADRIFSILTTVAVNSSAENLSKFLPLFNPAMVKVCRSLLTKSSLLIRFVRFFTSICDSPEIVRATCNEDNCLWAVLAEAWAEAVSRDSEETLMELDRHMCQMLSQCMSHEGQKPPFITADDCHCPFDIGTSLVLYLHRYQKMYESVGKIQNLTDLQRGVQVLLHLTVNDPCIDDHRMRVKAEYISFLGWLNLMHKRENLGFAVEALLEKFFPLRD